jgi:putative oxidoreductase
MFKILKTSPDVSATIARLGLGLFILPHGAQKALGWFGGHGIEGTVGFMQSQLGIPALFAYLAIAAEFLGGLGLIVGLFSRIAAFGVAFTLGVAAVMVHWSGGFLSGPNGAGMELHFLGIALGLIVMVRGGGWGSLDGMMARSETSPVSGRPVTTI